MTALDPTAEVHRAIRVVWKAESAKVIACIARMVRDVGLAEELAQDALLAALAQWPVEGIPRSPAAWLTSTAKHRAINTLRRGKMLERKHTELGFELEAAREDGVQELDSALDEAIGDDLLRLVFTACHPVLPTEGRIALTLRLLGGLTTDEIARAFLVSEPTVAQRIVRAKRSLARAQIPFEVPGAGELSARLGSVLEVIYLVFNEGYSATAGDDLLRPALCDEALRLGRILSGLAGEEPEVHGLVALMELNASRSSARIGPSGEPVLLLEQNRALWDPLMIERGLSALQRAESLATSRGPYVLQAAISACHARAHEASLTDWRRIATLYGELASLVHSPVVELNRAVAVSMAEGPAAGLALIDALGASPSLASYHLLPSARADLLSKLERFSEARSEFERAASLTRNTRQRERLLERAAACAAAIERKD